MSKNNENFKNARVFDIQKDYNENNQQMLYIEPVLNHHTSSNNINSLTDIIFYDMLLNQKNNYDENDIDLVANFFTPIIAYKIVENSAKYNITDILITFESSIIEIMEDFASDQKNLNQYKQLYELYQKNNDNVSKIAFILRYYIDTYHAFAEVASIKEAMAEYHEILTIMKNIIDELPEVFIHNAISMLRK